MKVWYPGDEPTIHATAGLLQPGENEVRDEAGAALVESGFCSAVPAQAAEEPRRMPVTRRGPRTHLASITTTTDPEGGEEVKE